MAHAIGIDHDEGINHGAFSRSSYVKHYDDAFPVGCHVCLEFKNELTKYGSWWGIIRGTSEEGIILGVGYGEAQMELDELGLGDEVGYYFRWDNIAKALIGPETGSGELSDATWLWGEVQNGYRNQADEHTTK